MKIRPFENPFRPGAGHMPPYLAGREPEQNEFRRLLLQTTVMENMILTGLRGVGKTVLLETFKPLAIKAGWLWVGTDLSESTSVSEATLATRLLTDLAVVSSQLPAPKGQLPIGFGSIPPTFDFKAINAFFSATPGLIADRMKAVLEAVWETLSSFAKSKRGIVFAYDEAQTLSDQRAKDQYPLSVLLDVFQSVQRKGVPFMLLLTGLPTLFPKCVEARTFSERMFRVVFLDRLNAEDSQLAITKPIEEKGCPVSFRPESVTQIVNLSGGYPYFIQFMCREIFDVWIQKLNAGEEPPQIPLKEIHRKLDSDFFAGRWARATDRQRELLTVAAKLEHAGTEFTVQELVEGSTFLLGKPFKSSHANQMLASLSDAGLVYKNRHGKYSFAVPLLDRFIKRQMASIERQQ